MVECISFGLLAPKIGRTLHFTLCRDDRIEVCVPENGTVYVYERVPSPPFLESVIELFKNNHHLTMFYISRIITRIHGIIASKWKWDIRFITDLQKQITG